MYTHTHTLTCTYTWIYTFTDKHKETHSSFVSFLYLSSICVKDLELRVWTRSPAPSTILRVFHEKQQQQVRIYRDKAEDIRGLQPYRSGWL